MICIVSVLFFFSSRRRHTRYWRDWSSDVCSSDLWSCKVIDRTGLILDIFGARARTREGALQVELAHLEYQRSRLVRSWTHLGRQRGGFGFLGGPGETQIEADRRLIGGRAGRPMGGPAGGGPAPRADPGADGKGSGGGGGAVPGGRGTFIKKKR